MDEMEQTIPSNSVIRQMAKTPLHKDRVEMLDRYIVHLVNGSMVEAKKMRNANDISDIERCVTALGAMKECIRFSVWEEKPWEGKTRVNLIADTTRFGEPLKKVAATDVLTEYFVDRLFSKAKIIEQYYGLANHEIGKALFEAHTILVLKGDSAGAAGVREEQIRRLKRPST